MAPKYSQWEKWECREEVQSLKTQADSQRDKAEDPVPTWVILWGSVEGLGQRVHS